MAAQVGHVANCLALGRAVQRHKLAFLKEVAARRRKRFKKPSRQKSLAFIHRKQRQYAPTVEIGEVVAFLRGVRKRAVKPGKPKRQRAKVRAIPTPNGTAYVSQPVMHVGPQANETEIAKEAT